MGIIRLLLALSVLIFHAGAFFHYNIINNTLAVFSFFIISGFYMELILSNKYTDKKSTFLFWSNRFLRIFPLYWLSLLIVFLFTLIKLFFHMGSDDNAILHYIKYAQHPSPYIFTLNLINYILRNITLLVTFDYVKVNDNTPGYLLVQQAWTLQIELLFYLLAPFLHRLSKKLFICFFFIYVIGFFGLVVPFHLLQQNLVYIFLNNILFFLLGMMSFRFFYQKLHLKQLSRSLTRSIFLFFVIYLLLYNAIPIKIPLPFVPITDFFYYIILIGSLPFIFIQTSVNILDTFIGKLSYPVYITHFIIIKLLSNISLFKHDSNFKTILIILLTLVVSIIAVKCIEIPIDKFRQLRIKNATKQTE